MSPDVSGLWVMKKRSFCAVLERESEQLYSEESRVQAKTAVYRNEEE